MKRFFCILLCLAAVGCARSEDADRVHVVTSFYPLAEAAQAVGGEHVRVDDLTPVGGEAHDLELTPETVAMLESADVVFYAGSGFQPALERALRRRRGATVDVLSDLGVSNERDPHVWLSPSRMGSIATAVENELSRGDPAHRLDYKRNADRFRNSMQALDDEYREGLANCAHHDFVTTHAAFGHLAIQYGLEQHAVIGLTPEAEASPGRLSVLTQFIKNKGISTVFYDSPAGAGLAKTLAHEAQVKTAPLSSLESLSPKQKAAGDDYESIMRTNLAALRVALDCH